MKFSQHGGIFAGHIDIGISDTYKLYPAFFSGFSILITCIDSTKDVPSLRKWVSYLRGKDLMFQIINSAIWLASPHVIDIFEDRQTFFGFDELYMVREPPNKVPTGDTYTTDVWDFGKKVPDSFLLQFRNYGAVSFLSDGIGMNFACDSLQRAQTLVEVERLVRSEETMGES